MSEKEMEKLQEKSHLEQMDSLIAKRIKPIYWIFFSGVVPISIFLMGVILHLNTTIANLETKDEATAMKKTLDKDISAVYENFISKQFYHQLQKDEHTTDVEAIQNPQNASNVYLRHNIHEADELDIRYRGPEK